MEMNLAVTPLTPAYRRAVVVGSVVVLTFLVLSALLLDGGLTLQVTFMAILGYLGGLAVMASRRSQAPSGLDLLLVRWGFIPLWIAAQFGARYAWTLMGRLS
jgi:hypothetical protein